MWKWNKSANKTDLYKAATVGIVQAIWCVIKMLFRCIWVYLVVCGLRFVYASEAKVLYFIWKFDSFFHNSLIYSIFMLCSFDQTLWAILMILTVCVCVFFVLLNSSFFQVHIKRAQFHLAIDKLIRLCGSI